MQDVRALWLDGRAPPAGRPRGDQLRIQRPALSRGRRALAVILLVDVVLFVGLAQGAIRVDLQAPQALPQPAPAGE